MDLIQICKVFVGDGMVQIVMKYQIYEFNHEPASYSIYKLKNNSPHLKTIDLL